MTGAYGEKETREARRGSLVGEAGESFGDTARKPPESRQSAPQLVSAADPAVGIASNSVRYLTAASPYANAGHRMASEASAFRPAGPLPTGETAGAHTSFVKCASSAQAYNLPQLRFLLYRPVLVGVLRVANGQGVTDEWLIDGVDKPIDSRASMAALTARGRQTGEEVAEGRCILTIGL